MNRCVVNLMIVPLFIVNNACGMYKILRALSCGTPEYNNIEPAKIDKKQAQIDELNDVARYAYIIHLSLAPSQVTIQRFLNSNNNNRWTASYENIEDADVVEIKLPHEKISNNKVFAQHFDIVGKRPGSVNLLLSEFKRDTKIKTVRVPITVVK